MPRWLIGMCVSVAVVTLPALGMADTAAAGYRALTVEAGSEKYSGYTKYQIGGKISYPNGSVGHVHFPISELRFPLEVYMAYLGVQYAATERFRTSVKAKTNINRDAGVMRDSDWGYYKLMGKDWGEKNSLDIFSESETRLGALIVDASIAYRVMKRKSLNIDVGAGFLYQRFNYTISDIDQWYPSYSRYSAYIAADPELSKYSYEDHVIVHGIVATYDIDYYIPYVTFSPYVNLYGKVEIKLDFMVSPWLKSKDADDHILRSKIATGDSTGMGIATRLGLRFFIEERFHVALGFCYSFIRAEGRQTQERYEATREGPAEEIGTLENRIRNETVVVTLGVGCSFF